MSIIKNVEESIANSIRNAGYDVQQVKLQLTSRPDLGQYQINEAFNLGKEHHKNPRDVANEIVKELEKNSNLTNLNIAGPGFINISFTPDFFINCLSELHKDIHINIDKKEPKTVMIDYGGANIAKTLHVGHLRSANIGEALKRLTRLLGHKVISDVHFGDIGRQSGMVISEIKKRNPDLCYFKEDFKPGDDSDFTITAKELGEIYPTASLAAKEDEQRMEEVRSITAELEEGHVGYSALWKKITDVSKEDIKKVYERINTDFDLWEGETDCYPFIPEMLEYLKENNYVRQSEGAYVIDIEDENDNAPMPPLVVIKSNGATLYGTRELATLYSRMKRFSPDEIWYVVDSRQSLYFEQTFRAAKKTHIVPESTNLEFLGFGTMNGQDGKPFKTRDGGLMSLTELIEIVKDETTKRLNENIVESERESISEQIAISALKYADFLPYRSTDYIFEPSKFSDLEGKTGPYLLYSTIRMNSLLNKSEYNDHKITKLKNNADIEVILSLLNLPTVLTKAFESKSLNEIAEYLYKLTSTYNKFYSENRILSEEDKDLQSTWLGLTQVVRDTNLLLLDILGLTVPNKM